MVGQQKREWWQSSLTCSCRGARADMLCACLHNAIDEFARSAFAEGIGRAGFRGSKGMYGTEIVWAHLGRRAGGARHVCGREVSSDGGSAASGS